MNQVKASIQDLEAYKAENLVSASIQIVKSNLFLRSMTEKALESIENKKKEIEQQKTDKEKHRELVRETKAAKLKYFNIKSLIEQVAEFISHQERIKIVHPTYEPRKIEYEVER